MSAEITVIKRNIQGDETWRYSGKVIRQAARAVLLEAAFNRGDMPFFGICLRRGDRFVEIFFSDRWYNIFEIHDRQDDRLKGWYCNITRPAEIRDGFVSYVDLGLDLLVYPDGRQLVLDEDEFTALQLPDKEQEKALQALKKLQALFEHPAGFQLMDVFPADGCSGVE